MNYASHIILAIVKLKTNMNIRSGFINKEQDYSHNINRIVYDLYDKLYNFTLLITTIF